jgi:hypothetical protein
MFERKTNLLLIHCAGACEICATIREYVMLGNARLCRRLGKESAALKMAATGKMDE